MRQPAPLYYECGRGATPEPSARLCREWRLPVDVSAPLPRKLSGVGLHWCSFVVSNRLSEDQGPILGVDKAGRQITFIQFDTCCGEPSTAVDGMKTLKPTPK